jgi:hypothetical protein
MNQVEILTTSKPDNDNEINDEPLFPQSLDNNKKHSMFTYCTAVS